ncbi:MAG: carbonic anhydrase [Verrucomicrobiota bacterium]
MQQLIKGVHGFRQHDFGRYRDLFQRLSTQGQKPQALFITCADSRVVAELITRSRPGDLFVVKNVGNIVPPADAFGSTNSTAAAIEFAVGALEVEDIVICGHSQCGAMEALLKGGDGLGHMPHLREWLEVAAPVRRVIQESYSHIKEADARHTAAAEENVLFGMDNLRAYPCVAERLKAGKLRLHAWFFKIATAELFAFDPETAQYQPLVPNGLRP